MTKTNKLLVNKTYIEDKLNTLSLFSLFVSYYAYLFGEAFFGLKNVRITFLAICYASFLLSIFIKAHIKIDKFLLIYLTSSIFFYLLSVSFWYKKFDINLYLSTITVVIIINSYDKFIKMLKIFIYITFILATYEFLLKEYIFVVFRNSYFGYRALNEHYFAGSSGIFRSKVYFEGPLALSQLTMGLSFVFRKDIKILIILFVIAVFANGRLGMLVSALIIILYYIDKFSLRYLFKKPFIIFSIIVSIIAILIVGISILDQNSLSRLLEAFNTKNEGNIARIRFWLQGLTTWWEYDLMHKIFGNNGYYEKLYRNNAENGWFTLLVNNGIIGFLFYFIPPFVILVFEILRKSFNKYYIFILFFIMFIQTFHLGASANLLYWVIIFTFINNRYEFKV